MWSNVIRLEGAVDLVVVVVVIVVVGRKRERREMTGNSFLAANAPLQPITCHQAATVAGGVLHPSPTLEPLNEPCAPQTNSSSKKQFGIRKTHRELISRNKHLQGI